jgi:hypothetical protein
MEIRTLITFNANFNFDRKKSILKYTFTGCLKINDNFLGPPVVQIFALGDQASFFVERKLSFIFGHHVIVHR